MIPAAPLALVTSIIGPAISSGVSSPSSLLALISAPVIAALTTQLTNLITAVLLSLSALALGLVTALAALVVSLVGSAAALLSSIVSGALPALPLGL